MSDLKSKNIIVTGASGGIGNSIIEKLYQAGANILASGTKIERLDELNKLNFKNGQNKLISNVTANEIKDLDELKNLLIEQIENRVRWRESVINMIENNVNHFIEIGPGKVLSGLVKRINRDVKIDTINSLSDIESIKV